MQPREKEREKMLKKLGIGAAAVLVTGAMSLMTMGGLASAATTYGTAGQTCGAEGTASSTVAGDLNGTNDAPDTAVGPAQVACVAATETITAGTLHFNSVAPVGFIDITLDGFNQDPSNAGNLENVDVTDATGSNDGWNISIEAPALTDGAATDGTLTVANFDATTGDACDTASTCTLVAEDGTAEPLSASSAVVVSDTLASTGEGAQNFNYEFDQPAAASASAGSYHATWTYTLSSGPAAITGGTVNNAGTYGALDETGPGAPLFG